MAKRTYLSGLPRLKRKLTKLKEDTWPKVEPVIEAWAQRLVDRMQQSVPVDSGKLRDSIKWGWGDPPHNAKFVFTKKIDGKRLWIAAGDDEAWYVRFVEFGTASHEQGGSHPGTTHPGVPPHPFFFNNYREFRKLIKRDIRKAIKEAVRGAIK